MNNILISIIVPAYNIENYIGRCLDSILHQQYTELALEARLSDIYRNIVQRETKNRKRKPSVFF